MRIAYLGPEGTFTHAALLASQPGERQELLAAATIHEAIMAVQAGAVDEALVPIENSLEGSVNVTLDTLALEAPDVRIVAEVVQPVSQCLIARPGRGAGELRLILSHPQASAQCAAFLRSALPGVEVRAASSTAGAVQAVAASPEPWGALGPRAAAELYGCAVVAEGVEDDPGNETRFAWLARREAPLQRSAPGGGPVKTALVFWGPGAEAPGWLVRCLSEFAYRAVNLTRIESRPLRQGLGSYMFFLDLEGEESEPPVAEALEALRGQVQTLRVLGSFARRP
jgi:prephenate dehydratase